MHDLLQATIRTCSSVLSLHEQAPRFTVSSSTSSSWNSARAGLYEGEARRASREKHLPVLQPNLCNEHLALQTLHRRPPDREDIRPEPPVKVKGLRLAHLHEREQLLCGLPGCALLFSHFKVGDNSSVSTSRREGARFSKET